MKVLFLTNIPSPYRVDFFNQFGKMCNLTVVFEGSNATNRDKDWISNKANSFRAIILNGIRVNSEQFFCPGIIKYLRASYTHIILGGYSSPTSMIAIEYMRLRQIPFWLEVDGGIVRNDSGMKYYIKRHFISAASSWLASSEDTVKYLEYYGANKQEIYKYPFSSVHANEILKSVPSSKEKANLRKELNINNPFVLAVGQFIPRKGFDILIKAFKQVSKQYDLYIIGGRPTSEYTELVDSLHLNNVYFIEFKSKEKLNQYYQAAELFILPTREDIWGLVINEALANGLPVITTDHCIAGLELIKNDEDGYIVPVDDVNTLANRMNAVLSNETLKAKMSCISLIKIQDYTIEKMVQRHIEVLELRNKE